MKITNILLSHHNSLANRYVNSKGQPSHDIYKSHILEKKCFGHEIRKNEKGRDKRNIDYEILEIVQVNYPLIYVVLVNYNMCL